MIVLLHVLSALTSMVYTTYLLFFPSKSRFYAAYGLVGLTLASGTYLVWSTHVPMLKACASGLTYLVAVSAAMVLARRRLASSRI
jgi:hypothetical protein